jgi:hypothetical protein
MIPLDLTRPGVKLALALGLGATLLVVLLCLACAWGGYRHGHNTATDAGEAKYAKLEASQAESNRLASDTARRIVDAEIIRRDALAESLSTARATIAAQSRKITNQRINDASQSVAAAPAGGCVFGPAWVRLWNEALDLGHGDPAVPGTSSGSGRAGGSGQAADAGLPAGAVTEADVLANHADNAQRCRDTKAKYLVLREWALGLPKMTTEEAR